RTKADVIGGRSSLFRSKQVVLGSDHVSLSPKQTCLNKNMSARAIAFIDFICTYQTPAESRPHVSNLVGNFGKRKTYVKHQTKPANISSRKNSKRPADNCGHDKQSKLCHSASFVGGHYYSSVRPRRKAQGAANRQG